MNISNIKTGDYGICKADRAVSKTIKFSTGSEFSHTTQFYWMYGVLYVIEAQDDGIVVLTFDAWRRKYNYEVEIFRDPFHPVNESMWITHAKHYLGVAYDRKGLAVGLFRSIVARVKKFLSLKPNTDMNDKYRNNGKFWCSEYTAKLIGVRNPEDYSPQNIYDYFKRNNWIKIEI